MDKHVFDKISRVPSQQAGGLECETWLPPTVNEGGHLVYAAVRPGQRREGTDTKEEVAGAPDASVEQERQRGYDAGYAEGLAAGTQEGKRQGEAAARQTAQVQLNGKLQNLNQLLTTLSHSLNEEDYKLEQTLLQLVQEIAAAVIKQEMKLAPEFDYILVNNNLEEAINEGVALVQQFISS